MTELCYNCMSPNMSNRVKYGDMVFCTPDCFLQYLAKQEGYPDLTSVENTLCDVEDRPVNIPRVCSSSNLEAVNEALESVYTLIENAIQELNRR